MNSIAATLQTLTTSVESQQQQLAELQNLLHQARQIPLIAKHTQTEDTTSEKLTPTPSRDDLDKSIDKEIPEPEGKQRGVFSGIFCCRPRFSRASGPRHIPSRPTSSLTHPAPIASNVDPDLTGFQRAVEADQESVLRFFRDFPPTAEPVDDYITDLDERCALFGEMQQLLQDHDAAPPTAALLAFFMVAPTAGIREHLATIRKHPATAPNAPNISQDMIKCRVQVKNLLAPGAISSCNTLRSPPCPTWSNNFPDIPTNRFSIPERVPPVVVNPDDAIKSNAAAWDVRATHLVIY